MTTYDRLRILQEEVELLESRLEPTDTGHLHTTINVLNKRIEELESELRSLDEVN